MKRRLWESIAVVVVVATLVWAVSSFTPNLNLEKPAQGDLNWHTAVNGNMDILDDAVLHNGTVLTSGRVPYVTTGGEVKDEAALAYNEGTNTLTAGVLNLTTPLADAYVADTITASSYLPLAGGTMTGQLVTDNLGIEFEDSDTNPTCAAGNYSIYADLSETKIKQCVNGVASDIGGGSAPTDATYITQTANGTLSAEQALSSLSTGIMRVATTTGVITSLTDSAGIAANISDETGSGALCFGTSPTLATPVITGKVDRNNTAVDDDDCTGEQGLAWYDTTDSAFEFCNANSGAPAVLGGAGGTPGGSSTHVQFNNAGSFGGSANFTWDNTNARFRLQNGTTADDNATNLFQVSGTLPTTPSASVYGALFDVTTAGSAAQNQFGVFLDFKAGYTGANPTIGYQIQNGALGTGNDLKLNNAAGTPIANVGQQAIAYSTGTGAKVGAYNEARGSSAINVGDFGKSAAAVAGTNIGVLGNAANSTEATDLKNVAGLFTLNATLPTANVSVALLAQSDGTEDIFRGYDGTTLMFRAEDSGEFTSAGTATIGWSVVAAANQACTTTCTSACVFGFDDGTPTIVDCSSATADKCVCAGAS